MISVLQFVPRWTASIDGTSYEGALADLDRSHACVEPGLVEASGQRLRLPG